MFSCTASSFFSGGAVRGGNDDMSGFRGRPARNRTEIGEKPGEVLRGLRDIESRNGFQRL